MNNLLFSCIISLLQLLTIFDYVKQDVIQNQMQISLERPEKGRAKRNVEHIHMKQFSNIVSKCCGLKNKRYCRSTFSELLNQYIMK
jgi:hypothetical protein